MKLDQSVHLFEIDSPLDLFQHVLLVRAEVVLLFQILKELRSIVNYMTFVILFHFADSSVYFGNKHVD